MEKFMEKYFKLQERDTTVRTEILAGLTTFMAMAYILMVNAGMFKELQVVSYNAIYIATAISAVFGTLFIGLVANLPLAQASGMGLNAFFVYTVCFEFGLTYANALTLVLLDGIIFIILTATGLREKIFNSIPDCVKKVIPAGIGLFIAFIGLQNAGLSVDASTLVTITSFTEDFHTKGICALLAVIGLLITAIFHIKKVKGGILYGILITWGLGIICELTGIYTPDAELGAYSLLPAGIISTDFSALGKTFGQCFKIDFHAVGIFNFIVIVFSFLFVDLFDTLGTLIGVSTKANMLDENGKLPNIKPALLSDAIATSAGAILGTSTTTTFVESSSGVAVGGRTGLTACTTGVLFLLATLFSPLFTSIPSFATAPALIFVGFLMFETVTDLTFDGESLADTIPAYLCIIAMPLFYSISEGICLGVISYVILQACTGNAKKINPLMYVLAVLFIMKYIFL